MTHINVPRSTPVTMSQVEDKDWRMCLGIPMQVLETDGFTARCSGRGEERRVNVMLIDEVPPGGWVLVHLDNAVRALEEDEVEPLNNALDAILLAAKGESVDHLFADLTAPAAPTGELA